MKLPIKPIDLVHYTNWTGLTVAELFHAGRLGSDGADKKNIEQLARQFHPPRTPLEYQALLEIANEAYEYLLDEQQIELQIQRANTYQ